MRGEVNDLRTGNGKGKQLFNILFGGSPEEFIGEVIQVKKGFMAIRLGCFNNRVHGCAGFGYIGASGE
jgi:hypothetical protein